MNSFLKRNRPIITWLSGLGIPISLIIASWIITKGTETSKLESEYVRIALNILTPRDKVADGKEQPFTEEEKALRQWAVRLLNRQSPEKFTEAEQQALLNLQQPFGRATEEERARLFLRYILEKVFIDPIFDKRPTPTPQPQPQRLPGPTKQDGDSG